MRTDPTENRQAIACQPNCAGQPAGHSVRLDLLKQILAVPTYSRHEGQMVEFLADHVREGGVGLRGTCDSDDWNNVYIRKGEAEFYPCVAAHIDTVHDPQPVKIVRQDGILLGMDERGQRAGIGADDKAGVFVCLELLERFDNIAVVLFGAEEIGCQGAFHARPDFFHNIGYVMEFDCPSRGLVSYTSNSVRQFANDGEFIHTALPVFQQHGLTAWQRHPYSDVMALRQRFNFSCLNLSCGYYNWHQRDEYLVLNEVQAALASGEDLVQALGCRRYTFNAGADDTALPLLEVTGLQLPQAGDAVYG
ncbi:MAG: M28 family peptidase [Thiobacillaceae bacterium]